MSAANII